LAQNDACDVLIENLIEFLDQVAPACNPGSDFVSIHGNRKVNHFRHAMYIMRLQATLQMSKKFLDLVFIVEPND